jgi:hypothetical protein
MLRALMADMAEFIELKDPSDVTDEAVEEGCELGALRESRAPAPAPAPARSALATNLMLSSLPLAKDPPNPTPPPPPPPPTCTWPKDGWVAGRPEKDPS